MRKIIVLLAILMVVALLILGCTRQSQYPNGYAAYGQQGQQPNQGYVGGGCAVAGPEPTTLEISEPVAAA